MISPWGRGAHQTDKSISSQLRVSFSFFPGPSISPFNFICFHRSRFKRHPAMTYLEGELPMTDIKPEDRLLTLHDDFLQPVGIGLGGRSSLASIYDNHPPSLFFFESGGFQIFWGEMT